MSNYTVQNEKFSFKHLVSENLARNAYSMHIHNSYELIYFLDGDATHIIEDRKYKLKKGDLIIIRPFQYHFIQIDTTSRYERYDILFDKNISGIEGVELIPEDIEVINLLENTMAEDVFRRFDVYYKNAEKHLFYNIFPHLMTELFYNVHLFSRRSSNESSFLSPLVSSALQYINQNLFTIIDVKEISDHLFVSESYLFRLFKKELHQTPKKYIREKRLLIAQNMLLSGVTPTVVCEKCGFQDYTTFYRNYTDFFGKSPQKTYHH